MVLVAEDSIGRAVCPAMESAEFTSFWPGLLSPVAGVLQLVPAGVE